MISRRIWTLAALIVALLAASVSGRSSGALAGSRAQALPLKKVCHTVIKKVHGKKKKVKVCKTVKPKPTATSSPTATPTATSVAVTVTAITPSIQALPPATFPGGEVRVGLSSSLPANGPVTGMTAGDLTAAGSGDVVVLHAASNTLSVLLSDGHGGFKAPVDYPTGKDPTSVTVGDVNGDGHPDLVVYNAGSNTLGVYINTGNGAFSAPPSTLVRAVRAQSRPHDGNGSGQTLSVPPGLGGSGDRDPMIRANLRQIALAFHKESMVTVWRDGPNGQFGPPSVTNLPLFTALDGAAIVPFPGGTSQLILLGASPIATGPVLAGFPFDPGSGLSSAPAFADTIVGATLPTPSSSNVLGSFTSPTGQPVMDFAASVAGSTAVIMVSPGSTQISVNGYTYPSCPPDTDVSPTVTNGQPGAIKLISLQTGQMCWIFFDRDGKPVRGQYVPWRPDPNDLPTWATVTKDPALIWFAGSGTAHSAPITTYGGSASIMGFASGASTIQVNVTLQAGTAPVYGIDIAGLHGSASVTGLLGASVTPISGGIRVSTQAPLPPSFSFTLGNLQPITAAGIPGVFGTDVNGTEAVWLTGATQS